MNLPSKIITYLYRTNTPKNIVVELHDEAVQLDNAAKAANQTAGNELLHDVVENSAAMMLFLRDENERLEYEAEELAESLSSAIQTAKDWHEIAEKRNAENDQLRALLAKIHDDAVQAPGGYLVSGELMRKIAGVLKIDSAYTHYRISL